MACFRAQVAALSNENNEKKKLIEEGEWIFTSQMIMSSISKVLSESICYYHAKVLQERRRNQGSWGGKKVRGGGCTILFRWNIIWYYLLSAQHQSFKDIYQYLYVNFRCCWWSLFPPYIICIRSWRATSGCFAGTFLSLIPPGDMYVPPHLEIWPDTSSLGNFPGFDHCSVLKRKEGRRSST